MFSKIILNGTQNIAFNILLLLLIYLHLYEMYRSKYFYPLQSPILPKFMFKNDVNRSVNTKIIHPPYFAWHCSPTLLHFAPS